MNRLEIPGNPDGSPINEEMMQKQSYLAKSAQLAFLGIAVMLMGFATKDDVPTWCLKQMGRATAVKEAPFHREWFDTKVDWVAFDKVYIPLVATGHLQHMKWWQQASLDRDLDVSRDELAHYTRIQFEGAFRKSNRRFIVVNEPGPGVLVIEMAIIEVIPTQVWLDAIKYVENYQVFEQGYTAVESRMRDGGSGKVIATVEVGEGGRGSSGPGFTWWGHSRNTIKYFAQTFENIVADGWQDRVSSRSPFTLVTW